MPDWILQRGNPDTLSSYSKEETKFRRVFYGAVVIHALLVLYLYLTQPRVLYAFVFFQGLMLWTLVVMVYAFYRLQSVSFEFKELLRYRSFRDLVTGAFNFRYLHIRLDEEYERTRRYGGFTSVLYIDLDSFKPVNDQFGHGVGNEVLKQLAGLMASSTRSCDVVGRIGGDEFLAVLPQTDREQATALAGRLRKAIENYELDLGDAGKVDSVTASIGVAAFPVNGDTIDNVLSAADSAVYEAKAQSGNAVCVAQGFTTSDEWPPGLVAGHQNSHTTDR